MATFSQDFKPVSLQDVYADASVRKADGWRYVQILAVNTENGVDLVYSYMLDGRLDNVVVNGVSSADVVPSISDLYLEAFVCENEIHDLYGLNISGIAIDFGGNFYQLSQNAPMTIVSPEQLAAREKAKKIAAAKAAKEAKAAAAQAGAPEVPAPAAASAEDVARERMASLDPEKAAKVAAALEARRKKAEAAAAATPAPAAPEPALAEPVAETPTMAEPVAAPVPEAAPAFVTEATTAAVVEETVAEAPAAAVYEPVVESVVEPAAVAVTEEVVVESEPAPVPEPGAPVIQPFQSTPIAASRPVPEPEPESTAAIAAEPAAPAAIPGAAPVPAPAASQPGAPVIQPFQSTPITPKPSAVTEAMAAQQAAIDAKLAGLDPEKAAKLRVLLEAQIAKSAKKAKERANASTTEGEGE